MAQDWNRIGSNRVAKRFDRKSWRMAVMRYPFAKQPFDRNALCHPRPARRLGVPSNH